MTDHDPKPESKLAQTQDWSATYRCVCGELVSLASGPASCSKCNRQYDSDVLRSATAETTVISTDAMMPEGRATTDVDIAEDEFLGQRLGHFLILNRIGSGGMGTVYRALDESLQRYVALKVLRKAKIGSDSTDLQRLFEEARAQARVNHPHVAHIYYVGNESTTPYLAMELVGHKSLADQLTHGPLPFHRIVRYALQIAGALEAAAKFDIVHGDVKPANVLMVDEQTVKLSDFGLASRLSESNETSSSTAGTPDYMPPEAMSDRSIDHRGDMYSLGVTLFEMTFGRLPHTPSSNTVDERLRLHREAAVEFPDPWPPELPQTWRQLLARLLEKDPTQRYTDFAALTADLRQLEPTTLPNARALLRGFAWLFDGLIVSSPLAIIAAISSDSPFVIRLFGTMLAAGVAVGIGTLQAWWGTTPGKRLFQIRIVDQHGLTPPKSVLGSRATFQFIWAWGVVLDDFLQLLPLVNLGQIINAFISLFIVVEMAFVVFGKGRSVHDRIFGTRVVLDAAVNKKS